MGAQMTSLAAVAQSLISMRRDVARAHGMLHADVPATFCERTGNVQSPAILVSSCRSAETCSYEVQGGLFSEQAINLLKDFYIVGNPNGMHHAV